MNDNREALTAAYVRILLRYGVGAMGSIGFVLAEDPDIVLVVTALVGLAVEAIYLRDWKKRGAAEPDRG